MPVVAYNASKFGSHWGGALSGNHHLTLSWNELVWAAMTMGKPGVAFLLAHGWHSVSDLIVRSHTVYANLRQVHTSIEKSNLYRQLDPTEKSGISYFTGMLAAKIVAARLLNVPWLFHLSMIGAVGGKVVLKGRSQPDLIGLRRNGDWIVVEAKGRTLGYSASAMTSAKLQTRQVRQINGAFPALRMAVQAYFGPKLTWALEDPEEFDEQARDMSFDPQTALDMYYSASVAATQVHADVRTIGDREFVSRTLEEVGVTVAIDRDVRERLSMGTLAPGAAGPPDVTGIPQTHGEFLVFADGLAVSLDDRWSEERMQKDPGARRGG